MDYEKEYKELVGKIDRAYLYAQTDSTRAVLEEIRPELAESEDERIREYLSSFVALNSGVNLLPEKAKKILAWLEKRGEQKPAWKPSGEQMKFLWKYAEQNNYDGRVLRSLFNDLKKLREV